MIYNIFVRNIEIFKSIFSWSSSNNTCLEGTVCPYSSESNAYEFRSKKKILLNLLRYIYKIKLLPFIPNIMF